MYQVFGWIGIFLIPISVISALINDGKIIQTEDYKKKIANGIKPEKLLVTHKWYFWLCMVLFYFGCLIMASGLGSNENNNSNESAKTSQTAKKKKPKKHKESKEDKEKSAEQSNAKKQIQKNLKQNLKTLQSKLAQIPDTTSGVITEAGFSDKNYVVTFVLSDDALEEADDQLESVVREIWYRGRDIVRAEGPYPDDTIDRDEPQISILDSAGHILGETSLWTGNFKYKGN